MARQQIARQSSKSVFVKSTTQVKLHILFSWCWVGYMEYWCCNILITRVFSFPLHDFFLIRFVFFLCAFCLFYSSKRTAITVRCYRSHLFHTHLGMNPTQSWQKKIQKATLIRPVNSALTRTRTWMSSLTQVPSRAYQTIMSAMLEQMPTRDVVSRKCLRARKTRRNMWSNRWLSAWAHG